MNNQLNNDEMNLSWSDNPEEFVPEMAQKEEKDRKKVVIALIKAFSMVVLAFALLIFIGIAWFTMNSDVGSDNMRVRIKGDNFELKTSGSAGTVLYHADPL